MADCIFCKIVKGEIPSFKVYEDDTVFAFADINPISDGHTLIIPKKHAENIWEIPADDLAAILERSGRESGCDALSSSSDSPYQRKSEICYDGLGTQAGEYGCYQKEC